MTRSPEGLSSCLCERLQDGTAEMGLCCTWKTSSPFLAWGDELSSKDKWIYFMIPRYHWHWRHACSDPCIMPTHKHTTHYMPQFTLEMQFSFPKHLFFQADQNNSSFEVVKHKNSLPLAPLPFLLISRAVYIPKHFFLSYKWKKQNSLWFDSREGNELWKDS